MTDTAKIIRVIGFGNPDCADDGIGALVARRLSSHIPTKIRTGDALALLEDWAGADSVILIDAALGSAQPGQIHRIDARSEALPHELPPSSTHAFGLAQAIDLARTLGALPAQFVVFAVEGRCFEPGAAMTPEVARAADSIVNAVMEEVRTLQVGETGHA